MHYCDRLIFHTLQLFERLLKERPDAFKQLTFLEGNVSAPRMGLKPEDQQKVIDSVSVVFHCAASLKLEAKLKEAVYANTLGTKHVLDFCSDIKKLDVSIQEDYYWNS